MIKKYINVANGKVVGNAGLRIGKDIIREGTKAVLFKTVSGVAVGLVSGGLKGVKTLDLDDVLGDLTRKENKVQRKIERMRKREEKLERKNKVLGDIEDEI